MELLLPARFEDSATAYEYVRTVFDQVAGGTRPATVSITPSTRHVGVTRRDTFRHGFEEAVKAAGEMGYPVLVRSSGGGATAADRGTFGFSIIRPADEKESARGIRERYDEAAALVLGAFSRLGVVAEVGEVRDEFCPGDHSIRVGDREGGMKVVGIAQRITRRATSVGGIVLVEGSENWRAYSNRSTTQCICPSDHTVSAAYTAPDTKRGHNTPSKPSPPKRSKSTAPSASRSTRTHCDWPACQRFS